MELDNNQKKHKEGVNIFKNFFEIKRPVKQQSSTLPRTNSSMEKDSDVTDKDRLFVRHKSYRRTNKKSKYKKEPGKVLPEKHSVESKNSVKLLCQKFEEVQPATTGSGDSAIEKITVTDKILTNTEIMLNSLREANKHVEVKRRTNDNKQKQDRKSKIKSFVDAENEGETEEFRQSFIHEMDIELANMKEDGFVDDTTAIDDTKDFDDYLQRRLLDCSEDIKLNLDQRYSHDSDTQTIIHEDPPKSDLEIDLECDKAAGDDAGKELVRFISQYEEFTESLGDELENGLTIVEAYNDYGRELIEVQVMIDRRVVNLDKQSLQEVINDSDRADMVFYKGEDQTFNLIQNFAAQYMENSIQQKNLLPSTSIENDTYEYIEIPNKSNPELPFLMFAPLSNRSTVYSTTSQDSSVFDEDDEGISLGRHKDNQEELYSNVRRETFCDNKGIVRIERVGLHDNSSFINGSQSAPVSRSNSSASCKKLDCIIEEILSTEKKYVDDLAKVVKLYKPFIERHVPPNLKDYQGYLFANLEKIYRRQRKFLQALEKSDSDVDQVIQCFIDHDFLFEMYPHYFRNKARADNLLKEFSSIIKEMQETFEERLDFSAYLLTPVQRLGRYILFLENIEKQLIKLNLPVTHAQTALAIVREEMSKGNDSVAIESIEHSPISKMDYGSFKMREKFNISKPRKVDAMVFLFSNVVVLATYDPIKLETFYYYDSIKMDDLRIATFNDLTIHLTDFTKSKKKQNSSKYTYVLETKTEKTWRSWTEAIEKMLWDQLLKVKENSMTLNAPRRHRNGEKNRTKSVDPKIYFLKQPFMENVELRREPTRKSKTKFKLSTFTSHFRSSKSGSNLISPPINFEKIDLIPGCVSPHVSIQECPFDVTGYGMLILKDKFKLKKPVKKKNVLVFMFERIIIITTEEEPDVYYYLGSIKMCDLSMTATKKRNRILLNDFNKNRQMVSNVEYNLKTKSEDIADAWKYTIEKCLWKELLTAREKSLENLSDL